MSRYVEHPSKVARWRDDGFEVLPDAAEATETVWTALPPDGDGDPVWEGLLAVRTAPDRAVIAAVPVFAYDLNLGDEVEVAASPEGRLVVVRPVWDAGRFTFRVLFPHADDPGDRSWVTLQQDLEPYACWFDVYSPQLVAVSAEPDVAQYVADHLEQQANAGRWVYETGRSVLPEAVPDQL
ncbi:MAG TPA: DUF4265 domain-containing protein [Blastococcus sp.]|nr:DUF4265 domain-containing protein [Blastococcus sp.]